MPLISLLIRALLYNFDEDSGARWALYDDGMEMPSAGERLAKWVMSVNNPYVSKTSLRRRDTPDLARYRRTNRVIQ